VSNLADLDCATETNLLDCKWLNYLCPLLLAIAEHADGHSLIQSHLSMTHSIAAKPAKQFFFGSVM
jgi:hypothetical protein